MKKIFFCSVILYIFFNTITASASASANVTISVNSKSQYSKTFTADVNVLYKNKELYNDNVFLSYHVFDSNHQLIRWEGERFPFKLDSKNDVTVSLQVDISSDLKQMNKQEAYVEFDLVDEEHAFWYSTKPEINLYTEQIKYSNNIYLEFYYTLSNAYNENRVIFIGNLIFLIVLMTGLFYWRMKLNR
ncbi:hypothetical protein M0651_18760 [Paenibacillus sp. MBLB2552]|uniref:Uncharacterized protein n=1 Tax=Paenibacillus mellifer TaxID=2937794 RepID=A0A9X1Y4F2_9BACL|nr:hypothetical protein [Paenibacillus mellifer]MCK8489218.1 hypothetical protein [Paenibacillus mellifer]